ncbi:MAG: hypothetical protein A3F40_04385 [Chlamydiae bacterium RIFCSPHIGHO2_12_FULL_27_8]|nr:MAG: hypothetical protein A3F40_04385 [Chlamydiae bacterium RIFCSPHIGHO2_12_FULL_27_8]OGN65145.1 MAG: hypothetical protein A2888_00720 [Chlamydiae bacterium RIFCSPLOWO2_01_FULL_28_7]
MFFNIIFYEVKGAYTIIIKNPSVENPKIALIISLAIKIFGVLTTMYAALLNITPYLGVAMFLFSCLIDIAIISNYQEIKEDIEESQLQPAEKGEKDALEFKEDILEARDRVRGFFKSLFSRNNM